MIDYSMINELLSNLNHRLKKIYPEVYVRDNEINYTLGRTVFRVTRPPGFNGVLIEYADTLEDASKNIYEDGDVFPITWGEGKIFEMMIKELTQEAKKE
jgi:hypothetical protein